MPVSATVTTAPAPLARHAHVHTPALAVILYGIVAEVEDYLICQPLHAGYARAFARQRQGDVLCRGGGLQTLHGLRCLRVDVHLLRRKRVALVKLRKADDIVYQSDKARGLRVDKARRSAADPPASPSVFYKLRAADYPLKRGLEFVRDVRRELTAAALGILLLRHVEGEDDGAACLYAAYVELILPPGALHAHFAVPADCARSIAVLISWLRSTVRKSAPAHGSARRIWPRPPGSC